MEGAAASRRPAARCRRRRRRRRWWRRRAVAAAAVAAGTSRRRRGTAYRRRGACRRGASRSGRRRGSRRGWAARRARPRGCACSKTWRHGLSSTPSTRCQLLPSLPPYAVLSLSSDSAARRAVDVGVRLGGWPLPSHGLVAWASAGGACLQQQAHWFCRVVGVLSSSGGPVRPGARLSFFYVRVCVCVCYRVGPALFALPPRRGATSYPPLTAAAVGACSVPLFIGVVCVCSCLCLFSF